MHLDFNSIKVRLERVQGKALRLTLANFNSIKVRLEQNFKWLLKQASTFQFHKGTIRTAGKPVVSTA